MGTAGTADDLAVFLRQFNPYKDLSASASCSTIATYVTNIINAATKNKMNDPSNMNAMLRAQMLATALSVYFSDPNLGNKIGAPVPIGGILIDLLEHICKMWDTSGGTSTCTGVEDGRPAFDNKASKTVMEMLVWAASQATANTGSTWYGQNKTLQGLAKDAFDSINNNVAIQL